MLNRTWRKFGPWVPFERPVTPPESGVFDPPLYGVCINEEWIPYLLGAMDVLRRNQTWAESDDDLLAIVERQWDTAMASVASCPGELLQTNYELYFPQGGAVGWWTYGFLSNFTPFGEFLGYAATPIDIRWRDIESLGAAGGQIDALDIIPMGPTALTVTGYDCLDEITSVSGSWGAFQISDLYGETQHQAKRIYIMSSATQCMCHLRWLGMWECGPA